MARCVLLWGVMKASPKVEMLASLLTVMPALRRLVVTGEAPPKVARDSMARVYSDYAHGTDLCAHNGADCT